MYLKAAGKQVRQTRETKSMIPQMFFIARLGNFFSLKALFLAGNYPSQAKREWKFRIFIMVSGQIAWHHESVYHLIFRPYQWS